MAKKSNVLVGIDIGTTKTIAIVGEVKTTGIDIIGMGITPAKELRKGGVVNIDSTVEAIKKAVEDAEHMSGCRINSAYVGIAGSHVKGQNSLGIVAVKGREVGEDDLQRALEASKAIAIPVDREILHTLPQNYVVDGQDGIRDPVGMSGVRLEAKVHIVTGAAASIQNVVKSVNRVGLDIEDVVLEQLAASEAILSADEKDLGVALIDIGGATTGMAIFAEGSIKHTATLPVGGNFLTSDIATGLRTPFAEAEKIKLNHGCAMTSMIPKEDVIEVPSVGGREARMVSRQILGRIVEPRMDEILNMALKEIVRSGYEDLLAAGIVLTGGSSLLPGINEMAEQIFDMPVRLGCPAGIGGLSDVANSPAFAVGVGLIVYGSKNIPGDSVYRKTGNAFGEYFKTLKKWFLEFF
ncbi:MAG: cell division protein FtsA [Smithellaceae bacterium]|jgi:cell division protein FtsA|nr:cell division protein FtsA [Smithellaceae bacterium]MDD3257817.1 cell division protein FtsA [Smithellaceae bacterium]MDD3847767.1 cell division protein FtsA [Smithellaceae bacterium]HOG12564.1 cell division protein FtsA [Smithellaceae bacterium]HOQ72469.1 cell division protein FtsA [Smithellaceae bacterium]